MTNITLCVTLNDIWDIIKSNDGLTYIRKAMREFLNDDSDDDQVIEDKIQLFNSEQKSIEQYLRIANNYGLLISSYFMKVGSDEKDSINLEKLRSDIFDDPILSEVCTDKKEIFLKEFLFILLTGSLQVFFCLQNRPAIEQNKLDYSQFSEITKIKLHKKQFVQDLNRCFEYVYEDIDFNGKSELSQLNVFVSSGIKNIFSSQIMKSIVEQRSNLLKTTNEINNGIKKLKNQIDNFNSRLIEIIGIILAIFSIIGFNIFTLSNTDNSFSSLQMLEINISVVLFTVVLLGMSAHLICDKKLTFSFYSSVIFLSVLLIYILFKEGTLLDIIVNVMSINNNLIIY